MLARLKVIEEMDGVEMETEEQAESRVEGKVSGSHVETGAAIGKGKQVEKLAKPNGSVEVTALGTSHQVLWRGRRWFKRRGALMGKDD